MVFSATKKTSVFNVGDTAFRAVMAGMALPMALFITTFCSVISMHVLSMALDQEKSIHRTFFALTQRIEAENHQEQLKRARHRLEMRDFITIPGVSLLDWIPDAADPDGETGCIFYEWENTFYAYPLTASDGFFARKRAAEQFAARHGETWLDWVWVEKPSHFVKKVIIQQDPAWKNLAQNLARYPLLYALNKTGELLAFDLQYGQLYARIPLMAPLMAQHETEVAVDPEQLRGSLKNETVVHNKNVYQYLRVVLQHPQLQTPYHWQWDISNPGSGFKIVCSQTK